MPVQLSYDRGTLVLSGLGRPELGALFERELWNWDWRVSAWRCDAINYAAVCDALDEGLGDRWSDGVPRPPRVRDRKGV